MAIVLANQGNYEAANNFFANILERLRNKVKEKDSNSHDNILKDKCTRMLAEIRPKMAFKIKPNSNDFQTNEGIYDSAKKETTEKHVGRNSLCPCGSGKKYKKCCLNAETIMTNKSDSDEYNFSNLFDLFGMDFNIAQYNVFGGARNYVLAILEGVVSRLSNNLAVVDIYAIRKALISIKGVLINGYGSISLREKQFASYGKFMEELNYFKVLHVLCRSFKVAQDEEIALCESLMNRSIEEDFCNEERLQVGGADKILDSK